MTSLPKFILEAFLCNSGGYMPGCLGRYAIGLAEAIVSLRHAECDGDGMA